MSGDQNYLPEHASLDHYRIVRVLGRGGFGITYLATEFARTTNAAGRNIPLRQVAIKEYFPSGIANRDSSCTVAPVAGIEGAGETFEQGLRAFYKEAQSLAQFDHENIVHIHRVFEENGTAYFVMPHIDGEVLSEILKRQKTFSELQAKNVLFPILNGLSYAHGKQVLHRDIKPNNIMVRRDDGRPVLIDFGTARAQTSAGVIEVTRQSELVAYTPGYAAFEQYNRASAQNFHSAAVDIYGLAAVFYHAINGRAPVESSIRVAEIHNGGHDPLVPLSVKFAGDRRFSKEFLLAIDWGLELHARYRPQSMASFMDAFKGLVEPDPKCLDRIAGASGAASQDGLATRAAPLSDTKRITAPKKLEEALVPIRMPVSIPIDPVAAGRRMKRDLVVPAGGKKAGRFTSDRTRVMPLVSRLAAVTSSDGEEPATVLAGHHAEDGGKGRVSTRRLWIAAASFVAVAGIVGGAVLLSQRRHSGDPPAHVAAPDVPAVVEKANSVSDTSTALAAPVVADPAKPAVIEAAAEPIAPPDAPARSETATFHKKPAVTAESMLRAPVREHDPVGVGVVHPYKPSQLAAPEVRPIIGGTTPGAATQVVAVAVPAEPVVPAPVPAPAIEKTQGPEPSPNAETPPVTPPAKEAKDPAPDANELYRRGLAYLRGTEGPVDYPQAVSYFLRAAEKGSADAYDQLGLAYQFGRGVPSDVPRALKYFQSAADAGNVAAMNSIAMVLRDGRGVPAQPTTAIIYFRKAALRGNAFALNSLGCAYATGNGVPTNFEKAFSYFQKAAEGGNAAANLNLGNLYRDGNGVTKDPSKAREYYALAARAGVSNDKGASGGFVSGGAVD